MCIKNVSNKIETETEKHKLSLKPTKLSVSLKRYLYTPDLGAYSHVMES